MVLDATVLKTAAVDERGNIICSDSRTSQGVAIDRENTRLIYDSVQTCLKTAGAKPSGLGIAVADKMLDKFAAEGLQGQLSSLLGMPVFIDRASRLRTIGEWRYGAGQNCHNLVCLFLQDEINGAVIADGKLLSGAGGRAGALGHITVVSSGRRCRCPNEGCLEAYVGGWAIGERTRDIVRSNPQGGELLIQLAGDIANISSATLAAAYRQNDALAYRMVKDCSKYLAAGLVSLTHIFNPEIIILGGRLISAIPDLLTMTEKRVREQALPPYLQDFKISVEKLGESAIMQGAAFLPLIRQQTVPFSPDIAGDRKEKDE